MGRRILADGAAVPAYDARGRKCEPRQKPQQARFSAAIGTRQKQQLPRRQREIQTLEEEPLAALAGQTLDRELWVR
jgi:hypothetical protein